MIYRETLLQVFLFSMCEGNLFKLKNRPGWADTVVSMLYTYWLVIIDKT